MGPQLKHYWVFFLLLLGNKGAAPFSEEQYSVLLVVPFVQPKSTVFPPIKPIFIPLHECVYLQQFRGELQRLSGWSVGAQTDGDY
jgi:hypothetical protein